MDEKLQIEKALGELSQIIDDNHAEHELQSWFENNPVVFVALGYSRFIAHPRLSLSGSEFIPDFMAQNAIGLWEIFEIKTADANILKNTERRHAFFSSTESNLSQCREYSRAFFDAACRSKFNNDYDTTCHKTPDVTMVVGRNDPTQNPKT
ncbi:MAG: DUF4263 domain-containing protein [Hydrogenophilaceae bacterium]|nr:DUF4263 domain-containing protein [Hydrogenophilaceae bacterium]